MRERELVGANHERRQESSGMSSICIFHRSQAGTQGHSQGSGKGEQIALRGDPQTGAVEVDVAMPRWRYR